MILGPNLGVHRRRRSSPPDLITLTTTLTGDFTDSLFGTGNVVFTWPDLTTQIVTLNEEDGVEVVKTLAGGGVITISNPSIIKLFSCISQSLTECDIPASLVNLLYLLLSGNALTESSVNSILSTLNSIPGLTGAIIDLSGGTSAAPTGAGITAYDELTAAGNTVTVNGYPPA